MTKLKTLKDIKVDDDGASPEGFDVNSEKLKQETIKWIKCEDENATTDATDAWIKHFFNITEEDLK